MKNWIRNRTRLCYTGSRPVSVPVPTPVPNSILEFNPLHGFSRPLVIPWDHFARVLVMRVFRTFLVCFFTVVNYIVLLFGPLSCDFFLFGSLAPYFMFFFYMLFPLSTFHFLEKQMHFAQLTFQFSLQFGIL